MLLGAALAHTQMPAAGSGIERTMSRLAASSTDRPEIVPVVFYGQSITKQNWWREVAADLRAKFTAADLRIENRSIGGYSTQFLIRTMEADILAFHPDPIVFHDYGAEALYEEIPTGSRHKCFDLPQLAKKYGLGPVDIPGGGHEHLKSKQLQGRSAARGNHHPLFCLSRVAHADVCRQRITAALSQQKT